MMACCNIFVLFNLAVLTVFTVVAGIPISETENNSAIRNPDRPPVYFNNNGKFKIALFADLHYGEGSSTEWGPQNDIKSTKVMNDILGWERPDFVVFTGDLVSAEVFYPNGSAYIDMLLQPVVQGNYRWATTYGNHDIGRNVTRREILETEQKYSTCYTQQGKEGLEGNTNYYIPVYPPQSANAYDDKPALILWFFDSRGGQNASGGIPAFVHENVVQWFKEESETIKDTWGHIPSLAFFHYPTSEYGPIHDNIANRPECPGQHDDIVTPQSRDGLMEALINSGIVKASFVGHNHGNGWCCNYKSMNLCYNRQSGHGGGWVGWTRGSRIVELDYAKMWGADLNYVRLENGTTIDYYPVPS